MASDYRDYVKVNSDNCQPSEPVLLVGSAEKAKQVLKWEPKVNFCEMVTMKVAADLQMLAPKGTS